MIICGQKCGTTTLWKYLDMHPEIRMSFIKELHYFDRHDFSPKELWYRSHFDVGGRVSGEATPAYCFWPDAMERIYRFDSQLKLILILRNPVDRAISQYWMEFNRKMEDLPMMDAFSSEAKRLATGDPFDLRHHSYLLRGRYHEQLDTIYKYFDKRQVLVCKLEDLAARTRDVVGGIFNFLGVRSIDLQLPSNFAGRYDSPSGEAKAYLREYFAPFNQLLAEKHKIAVADWN